MDTDKPSPVVDSDTEQPESVLKTRQIDDEKILEFISYVRKAGCTINKPVVVTELGEERLEVRIDFSHTTPPSQDVYEWRKVFIVEGDPARVVREHQEFLVSAFIKGSYHYPNEHGQLEIHERGGISEW